ncbi:MAG: hypothetical protein K0U74_07135 [Alphaproteobacteria bacterium]|nr:hypothetical protein [Alphaproteobacteria bacterium]
MFFFVKILKGLLLPGALVLLAACAGGMGPKSIAVGNGEVTPYRKFSMISGLPGGWKERRFGPASFEIEAVGTAVTPLSRVREIAVARAAERGVGSGYRFMKIHKYTYGFKCTGRRNSKTGELKASANNHPVGKLVVEYANSVSLDDEWLVTNDQFSTLLARFRAKTFSDQEKSQARRVGTAACQRHAG